MSEIILASASPQRKTLLQSIGLRFDVIPSAVDESACEEADPLERSVILARMKAEDVAKDQEGAFVIGSDTLVVSHEGELLEKPVDAEDARRMLRLHSGNSSIVHSAICLVDPVGGVHEAVGSSKVFFRNLDESDIDWWIEKEEWKGRSGSFMIDGIGQLIIDRIEGDFASIVGLPIYLLRRLAVEAGLEILE